VIRTQAQLQYESPARNSQAFPTMKEGVIDVAIDETSFQFLFETGGLNCVVKIPIG
jgi:hypothetical protein